MQNQLLTREFVPPRGSRAQKLVSRFALLLIPQKKRAARRAHLLRLITKDHNPTHPMVGIETMTTISTPLPENIFDEYINLPFENGSYMCTAHWDTYLKAKFGDYMTLPPEEERTWKHHPLILDFEHDFEELQQLK